MNKRKKKPDKIGEWTEKRLRDFILKTNETEFQKIWKGIYKPGGAKENKNYGVF